MDDKEVVILPHHSNLNDTGGGGLGGEGEGIEAAAAVVEKGSIAWQTDLPCATEKASVSNSCKNNQQNSSPDNTDLQFIQKHAPDTDPNLIVFLLDSQIHNPKKLECVCEMLDIPNASTLIEEFKHNSVKAGDKRSIINGADSGDTKKQKKAKENGYLDLLRDMFPDADGLFLISECQQLENEDDFSRFVNTVMLSGVYPKQGSAKVNYSPTPDLPKVVNIVNKGEYRVVVNYSSEEEVSSSGLEESPKRRRRKKKTYEKLLEPPVVDVIDISSEGTEPCDSSEIDFLMGVFSDVRKSKGSPMELEEIPQSWNTPFSDDIDHLLRGSVDTNNAGFSGLNGRTPRRQTLSGGTIVSVEKSLAEIIEDNRRDRRKSIASPIELGPSTSKDTKWMKDEISTPEVSTTSQPKPEVAMSVKENASDIEWIEEQTANLIRIFPNTDPSYLLEEVVSMNRSSEAMNEFVVKKLEKNDMPTRAEYKKKLEMEELQNRYTKNFSIEDFLKAVPDPWKYFSDVNRNCLKYKSHSLCYLKSNFRKHYVKDIVQTLSEKNNNLYLAYQALKNQEAKSRNNRRSEFECNRGRPTTIDVQFLQEVAFIENEEKIKEYLEAEKIARQIKFDEAKRTGTLLECQCCFDDEVLVEDTFYCPKDHAFCRDCITKSVEVEMGNGRCQFECLSNCNEKFTLTCLQNALKPELFSKVIRMIQMEEIRAAGIEDLVQCPFCNYATIMPPEEKVMVCLNPECLKESCRSCKELNHIPLRCSEVEKSEEVKMRTYIENKMTEALVRTCYKCGKKFVKEDGCNKMTCPCGATMCYVCRKPVSGYSHFNAQGGTEYHKCPLYSMNDELHVDLVKRAAEEAKAEIMQANPQTKLIYDPTIIMPERSNEKPIPGINNGAALDVAMRAIRREQNLQEEDQARDRGGRRRHEGDSPPRRPATRAEETDSEEESPDTDPHDYVYHFFNTQHNHHHHHHRRHNRHEREYHYNLNYHHRHHHHRHHHNDSHQVDRCDVCNHQ